MSFPSSFPKPQLPESMNDLQTPPKLHLWTAATPNGYKVSIILEELILAYPDLAHKELSYDYTFISFDNKDQRTPGFLAVNPNGRIPTLVDDNVSQGGWAAELPDGGSGAKVAGGHKVFESASIMLWLVENYDKEHKFWFKDPILRSKALTWIFWTQGGE